MTAAINHTSPWKQVLMVWSLFFLLTLTGILRHELWLDEAQHFLIARDSASIAELFHNMRYDGHVQLWNYLLYFITHFISSDPLAMQIFHLLVINAAALLLLRFAPFSLPVKLAILFGYYFLFEYSLISRSYALGITLLFACCALAAYDRRYLGWISVLCLLLCNTHLFFLFAATGIYLYYLVSIFPKNKIPPAFIFFTVLMTGGILFASFQMAQLPEDNTYFHPSSVALKYRSVTHPLYSVSRGFLPLQNFFGPQFWNSYLFDQLSPLVKIPLSLLFLCVPVYMLQKSTRVVLFYLACLLPLLVFLYTSQMLGNRYFGMFFLFFLCASWLLRKEKKDFAILPLPKILLRGAFYGILFLQLVAGVYAYGQDLVRPFSESRAAVTFMEQQDLARQQVVVDGYGSGPSISAYLGRPVIYLDIDKEGSYCIWKQSYFPPERPSLAQEFLNSREAARFPAFILIANRPAESVSHYRMKELGRFTGGLMKPDYFIYQVNQIQTNHVVANNP